MNEFTARYTDDLTARRLIDRLFEAGQKLPDRLRDQLLEAGGATGRALIALLEDRRLRFKSAPGGGWVPIHATNLLGERREPAAVEPLIEVVKEADINDLIHSRAVFALQKMGRPAMEPVLQTIHAEPDAPSSRALAEVLCELDVKDERILDVLLDIFDDDPALGASYLASYGDAAALDVIHDLFATLKPQVIDPFANHVFIELAAAIEALGGELTDDERAKLNRANQIRRQVAQVVFGAEAELTSHPDEADELGGDEPCWCGSGTKYKNCHGAPDRGAHP